MAQIQYTTLEDLKRYLSRATHLSDQLGESRTIDASALWVTMRGLLYNREVRYTVTFEASLAGGHVLCTIGSKNEGIVSCTAKGEWAALRGAVEELLYNAGLSDSQNATED